MDIADRLDGLRQRYLACNALVLADIETGMPLRALTKTRLPQEQIDQLAESAMLLLGDAAAALTSAPVCTAIVIDDSAVEIFLRVADAGTEVLCCDLSSDANLNQFAAEAWHLLAELSAVP